MLCLLKYHQTVTVCQALEISGLDGNSIPVKLQIFQPVNVLKTTGVVGLKVQNVWGIRSLHNDPDPHVDQHTRRQLCSISQHLSGYLCS